VPQLLAAGSVDLGVGSNSFIVMNLVQEKVPVKAVAAVFQKDPQVLIAHPDTGVNSLADRAPAPARSAPARSRPRTDPRHTASASGSSTDVSRGRARRPLSRRSGWN